MVIKPVVLPYELHHLSLYHHLYHPQHVSLFHYFSYQLFSSFPNGGHDALFEADLQRWQEAVVELIAQATKGQDPPDQ